MKHVDPAEITDYRTDWARHARVLRTHAREWLDMAQEAMEAGKRDRAIRYFNEWRELTERARWYGRRAVAHN